MTPDTREGQPMEWETGKPPNEVVVEVQHRRSVLRARAIWGRDGVLPHWESEDRNTLWPPHAFTKWRHRTDG
ncbi:MAG: hypothetical protein GEV06_19890 [Luteitalea sp.]|nr:hypothetical protein [Luteitalea sp.]